MAKFVYIMTAPSPVKPSSVMLVYIGVASNPFCRVQSQNRIRSFPVGSRLTRVGAPNWKLNLIIGPFRHKARLYQRVLWKRMSELYRKRPSQTLQLLRCDRLMQRRQVNPATRFRHRLHLWSDDVQLLRVIFRELE
jgi:hypothetical protein